MKSPAAKLPPLTPQRPPPLAPSLASQEANPPSPPAPEANAGGQTETARVEPSPPRRNPRSAPRPVTAEALADALPPKVPQSRVDLPTAIVGSLYRAELPTFFDPGGKGLRLTAIGLPEGLTLTDLGAGKGAIEGVPRQSASASVRIVATNHNDRTAQMSATLVVADKPAPTPAPVAKLEPPVPRLLARRPLRCSASAQPAPAPAQVPRLHRLHRQSRPHRPPRPTKQPRPRLRPRLRRNRRWRGSKRPGRNRQPPRPLRFRRPLQPRPQIWLRLSRRPRRRKRPRRSSPTSTAASASSSSRSPERPDRMSTRRLGGRSSRSGASMSL